MNNSDPETRLRELGTAWENDPSGPSFVEGVMDRVGEGECTVDTSISSSKGLRMLKLNVIGLVSLASIVLLFLFLVPHSTPVSANSLSVAMLRAVEDVDSVHVLTYGKNPKTGELEPGANTWLVRGKGYARKFIGSNNYFEIDNGQYFWAREGKDAPVTRTKSQCSGSWFSGSAIVGQTLASILESEYERLEDEDITVEGKRLTCYSMKNLAPFKEGPQRRFVYVDQENRLAKTVTWMFKDNKWNLFNEERYHYNVDVDEKVFELPIEAGTKIIDKDKDFDALVNLESSLFRATVSGIEYAVHRVRALQGGGVMIFASVRPSESESKVLRARMNDQSIRSSDAFRIRIGDAYHNDINAQWFVWVPLEKGEPNNLHFQDGTWKFQENFRYWDESEMLSEEFSFQYATLDVEVENGQEPISIEEAAKETYRDLKSIPHADWRNLDTGIYYKDNTPHAGSSKVDSISEDDFTKKVVEHLAHWRGQDLANERNAIKRAIKWGTVQIRVPGLDVSDMSSFSDDDLAKAAKRKDLLHIHVNRTAVTDEGLKSLLKLDSLKTLTLASLDITDDGLTYLEGLKSLELIDVRETKVTLAGIEKLKAAIEGLEIKSDFDEADSDSTK